MTRIYLTGASGFIGQALALELTRRNYRVTCLVRATSDLKFLKTLPVQFALYDLPVGGKPEDIFTEEGYVIHAGGLTRARSRAEFFRVNAAGTGKLCADLKPLAARVKKLILLSSQAASGPAENGEPVTEEQEPHPVSWYGESKAEGEKIAGEFRDKFPLVILRPAAVYGPFDRDFYKYFRMARLGFSPFIGTRDRIFSVVYVQDLVRAVITCLEKNIKTGEVFFVAHPEPSSWQIFAKAVARTMDKKVVSVYLPEILADFLAKFGDLANLLPIRPVLVNTQKMKEFKASAWLCSAQKMHKELGFTFQYPLVTGLKETYDWYKKNNWL